MNNNLLNKIIKKSKIKSKCSKTIITAGESLYLNSDKKIKIEEITSEIKELFKKSFTSPEDIYKFIESKGSKVIRAKHLDKMLTLIGEKEGFLSPLKGKKALFLSLMINILSPVKIPVRFQTKEMFVFQDKPYSSYLIIHQIYHWISFLKGLPGYEDSSLDNFKSIFNNNLKISDISKMTTDEIIALKETISRDLEAINLVKEISRETVGSKNCFEKMKNGENFSV